MKLSSIDFHAHHSPFGAYGSFTLGKHAATGGFNVHDGRRPGSDDVFVGLLQPGRGLSLFPFYRAAGKSTEAFAVEGAGESVAIEAIPSADIIREMSWSTDRWSAGPLSFALHTPFGPVPDPESAGWETLGDSILPAVHATLSVDNTAGAEDVLAVFGLCGEDTGVARIDEGALDGFARQGREGFAVPAGLGALPFAGFSLAACFRRDLAVKSPHLLGPCFGMAFRVPAGARLEVPIAIGWHVAGDCVAGRRASYGYARLWNDLNAVLAAALSGRGAALARGAARDAELAASGLPDDRQFLIAHATRGYFGNSQLLADDEGRPFHIVNEGEYCMINTLDLSIDQAFFEMRWFPWAARSVLDRFLELYSYRDEVRLPVSAASAGEPVHPSADRAPVAERGSCPGGVSFTHDMGVRNQFSAPGCSSYEMPEVDGCFSYMTTEELCNWILLAAVYVEGSRDAAWAARNAAAIADCLESLERRDHPEAGRRKGYGQTDSTRCGATGGEITTYDSLDPALSRARGNLYMAVKAWATWLALDRLFVRAGSLPAEGGGAGLSGCGGLDLQSLSARAADGARRAAGSVADWSAPRGHLAALDDGGEGSAIIPAIEPLAYPLAWGDRDAVSSDGRFGAMVSRLGEHLEAVLRPGVCLFEDGGWRLSSTSEISWLSKIFLCQQVAERVFARAPDAAADRAHARWLQEGVGHWGFVDQIRRGADTGSRYYPRGVTACLWLETAPDA